MGERFTESEESLAWRRKRSEKALSPPIQRKPSGGQRKNVIFGPEHDVHLYQIVLDLSVWDEVLGDFRSNGKGGIYLRGGWKAVTAELNRRFGSSYKPAQVAARMHAVWSRPDPSLDSLFHKALLLQEVRRRRDFQQKASAWFTRTVLEDGVQDGTETGRPRRD